MPPPSHAFARLVFALLVAVAAPAHAGPFSAGDIRVHQPWARALPPVAQTGAAYLRIDNAGATPDRLLGGTTALAQRVELHTHVHAGTMMRMEQVASVEIPAGGTVGFEPGGLHVMLVGLRQPLAAGNRFALALTFERAGTLEVEVEVRADAPPAAGGHGGHSMPGHSMPGHAMPPK